MTSKSGTSFATKEMSHSVERQQMHVEHQCWCNENALWHEELKIWQDELKQARDDLADVEQALDAHRQTLQQHGASLTLYQQETSQHEHELVDFGRGCEGAEFVKLAQVHQAETEHHARKRAAHEALKHRHHTIIARCSLLLKAVSNENETAKKQVRSRLAKKT